VLGVWTSGTSGALGTETDGVDGAEAGALDACGAVEPEGCDDACCSPLAALAFEAPSPPPCRAPATPLAPPLDAWRWRRWRRRAGAEP
jgi:hypothetical protein